MTSLLPLPQTASPRAEVVYPSSDGEPWAETSVHVDAIINAVVVLRHYLEGQEAIVLADQFLYYVEGFPKFRVAPDVMVIFNVPPGARDNYKIWQEKQAPSVIFEMTSAGTKNRDEVTKKDLYESLEVPERISTGGRGLPADYGWSQSGVTTAIGSGWGSNCLLSRGYWGKAAGSGRMA
jgi:hypothetical protein